MYKRQTYCSELRKAGLNITDQAGDDVDCVLCAYDTELTDVYKRQGFSTIHNVPVQRKLSFCYIDAG